MINYLCGTFFHKREYFKVRKKGVVQSVQLPFCLGKICILVSLKRMAFEKVLKTKEGRTRIPPSFVFN